MRSVCVAMLKFNVVFWLLVYFMCWIPIMDRHNFEPFLGLNSHLFTNNVMRCFPLSLFPSICPVSITSSRSSFLIMGSRRFLFVSILSKRIFIGNVKWMVCINLKRKISWIKKKKIPSLITSNTELLLKVALCIWWNKKGAVFY